MRSRTAGTARAGAAVAVALAVAMAGCSSPKPDDTNYASKLAAERAEKDASFQKDNEPIPPAKKTEFLPLAYFPIDQDYDVPAALKPIDDDTIYPIPTSSGTTRQMRKAGSLEFTLKGQPMKITAFTDLTDRNLAHLTVMFSDMTSGTETYPAGRYIDLDRSPTGAYELDFNRAYHPYCYYNASYECPYPPPENRLKVPIRAGERIRQMP